MRYPNSVTDGRGPIKKATKRRRDRNRGFGKPRLYQNTRPPDPDDIPPDSYDEDYLPDVA